MSDDDYHVIEPAIGATYNHTGEFAVYRYSTYPENSVLAGQERRQYLAGGFTSIDDARKAYPKASVSENTGYRPPFIPHNPPAWFDPANAGETWNDS